VLIAAMVGIAGSTRVGDGAMLGGQAGIIGHAEIGAGARVGAQAGVIGDIAPGETVSGYPARNNREYLRAMGLAFRLPEAFRRLQELERRIQGLEDLEQRMQASQEVERSDARSPKPSGRITLPRLCTGDCRQPCGGPLLRAHRSLPRGLRRMSHGNQRTIKSSVVLQGTGVHSGASSTLTFLPAALDHGIRFRRTDLEGHPEVPADLDHVVGTELGTSVGTGDVRVLTVEHVMAALSARGIDNAVLELSGPEPPILDGSFQGYVEALTRAGIEEQGAPRQCIRITEPVTLRLDSGEFYVAAPGRGVAGLRHHRIRARLHRTPVRDLPLEPGSLR
jgi:hypothetical protein